MFRLLIFFILLFFFTTFFMANATNEVIIHYYFGLVWQVKIYVLVMISFAFGILLSILLLMPEWISMKLTLKAKLKETESIGTEFAAFRKSMMKNRDK